MQGRLVDFSEGEGSRLPTIAPRNDAEALSSRSRPSVPASPTVHSSTARMRLPPRSKDGCWTCRIGKVKCDELKPNCGRCVRLALDCGYEQRISFRDDNQKVLDKEKNVNAASSPIWNPALRAHLPGHEHPYLDSLPAFAALATDEDRERKAELHKPGTFIVIWGPGAFARLPQYQNHQPTSPYSKQHGAPIRGEPHRQRSKKIKIEPQGQILNDPNIFFVHAFEDLNVPIPISPMLGTSPRSTIAASHSLKSDDREEFSSFSNQNPPALSKLDQARRGGQDAHLLEHYRSSISRHIIDIGTEDVDEDLFEIEARTYPPLFHAMMAISALSLAHRAGSHEAEALEHYQQVFPAMRDCFVRSEEDSNSDGALFTHYLLLLYDIASAGPWESTMWQSHSNALQKIITRRRQVNHTEPHGFLIWMICLVDTYALLSGSGDGAFTNFILNNKMLSPRDCLPSLELGHLQSSSKDELPIVPEGLELIQEVLELAVKVGWTARDLRAEVTEIQNSSSGILGGEHPSMVRKRRRVREIQDLCHNLPPKWQAKYPKYWSWSPQPSPKSSPPKTRGFCGHIYALYRACIIYSYTSMYPGQMAEKITDGEKEEVSARVTELVQLARQVFEEQRWDLQFFPFCLFLAGVASEDKDEKTFALKLLRDLEQQSRGANITAMRRLLKAIYDKQNVVTVSGAPQFRIDWVDEMRNRGLMLVMFSI